jgi:putative endonuclease
MAGHPLVLRSVFFPFETRNVLHLRNSKRRFSRATLSGHALDLKVRLAEHNQGKCPHTSKYKPWRIKFYAAFETLELAQAFERYLKSGSGHAFAKRHFDL